jgi:hypothetical protein
VRRSIITGKEIEPAPAGFFSPRQRAHVRRVDPNASEYRINAVARQMSAIKSDPSMPSQTTPKPKHSLKRTRGRVVHKGKKEALVASDGSPSDFARSLGRIAKRWLPRLSKGEGKDLSPAEVLALREAKRRKAIPRKWAIRHEKPGHRRALIDRVPGYPHLGQRWCTLYRGEEVES